MPTSVQQSDVHPDTTTRVAVGELRNVTSNAPVYGGVCLPRGFTTDANRLTLYQGDQRINSHVLPTAWWPDGSIKWAVAHFIAVTSDDHDISVALGDQFEDSLPIESAVQLRNDGFALSAQNHTAELRLRLTTSRNKFDVNFERPRQIAGNGLWSRTELHGEIATLPHLLLRAVIDHFVAIDAFRISVTIRNQRAAKQKGGLWDYGDPGSQFFESLSLQIHSQELASAETQTLRLTDDEFRQLAGGAEFDLVQHSSGGDAFDSLTHVDKTGSVPHRHRGFVLRCSGGEHIGLRATPVLNCQSNSGSLAVGIPEFWQQFPTSLASRKQQIDVGLFPDIEDREHELLGGEQSTQTVWLRFGETASSMEWIVAPPTLQLSRAWVTDCGMIPYLTAEPRDEATLDEYLEESWSGDRSAEGRREIIDEYGWRHYGELWADHEQAHYAGDDTIVSHYNNQFDVVYGGILQWLRTGDEEYRNLFAPLARHVANIDVYHTNQDRAAYNGGLFWHTDHFQHARTAGHRTYSRANASDNNDYGGGPSCEHNYTTGLLHYYWMTGDATVRDAVLTLADWVIGMDDGARSIMGVVDDGPSGLASATREPDYHGPGRGSGNSVNALLDAWLLEGDGVYLDKAESLIRRVVHPRQDIDRLELLDAERRWSYTVFLTVLIRYLDVKSEHGLHDEMFHYALESLRRYLIWMERHERPYLDHPEQLEHPDVAWSVQEMRKANVMQVGSRFLADPSQREAVYRRGRELAETAWRQIHSSEARSTARCLAILMVEGMKDAWCRQGPPPKADIPAWNGEFAPFTEFVPQKRRIVEQAKRPAGAIKIAMRLANPWRWLGVRRRG